MSRNLEELELRLYKLVKLIAIKSASEKYPNNPHIHHIYAVGYLIGILNTLAKDDSRVRHTLVKLINKYRL